MHMRICLRIYEHIKKEKKDLFIACINLLELNRHFFKCVHSMCSYFTIKMLI